MNPHLQPTLPIHHVMPGQLSVHIIRKALDEPCWRAATFKLILKKWSKVKKHEIRHLLRFLEALVPFSSSKPSSRASYIIQSGSEYLICSLFQLRQNQEKKGFQTCETYWRLTQAQLLTQTIAGPDAAQSPQDSLRCLYCRGRRSPAAPPRPGWCGREFSPSVGWRRAGSPALTPSARRHRAALWAPAVVDPCWWGLERRAGACADAPPRLLHCSRFLHHPSLHLSLHQLYRCFPSSPDRGWLSPLLAPVAM